MRFVVGMKIYPEQGSEGGRPYWAEEQIIEAEDRDDAKAIYTEINKVVYTSVEVKRDISKTIFAKKRRPLESTYWYRTRTTQRLNAFIGRKPLPGNDSSESFEYLCNERTLIDTGRSHLDRDKAHELLKEIKLTDSDMFIPRFVLSSTPEEKLLREEQIVQPTMFPEHKLSIDLMAQRFLQLIANRFHTALSMFHRSINPFSTKVFIVVGDRETLNSLSVQDYQLANSIVGTRWWIRNSNIRVGVLVPTYHVGKYVEYYLSAVMSRRHIYLLDRGLPKEFEAATKVMLDEVNMPLFKESTRHLQLNRQGVVKND